MTERIPDPIAGQDVLPWAGKVTRRLNALGDKAGATARNERNRRAPQLPQPFEVRWDRELNDGSGGWKIYLPTEHLLSYNGEDISTSNISGISVVQDASDNDTPWFVLDDVDTSADHVWLVVTISESSESSAGAGSSGSGLNAESGGSVLSVAAAFTAEEGQGQTGEKIINVCVAEISYDAPETEGEQAVVGIRQSLVGSLHLGGNDVGLSDDAPATPVLDHNGSTQNAASAGSSDKAARADHVHKLPTTVVDTENAQVIAGSKRFTQLLYVGNAENSGNSLVRINPAGSIELYGSTPFLDFHYGNSSADFTSRIIEAAEGVIIINSPYHARLGQAPITDPSAAGYNALQIATVGALNAMRSIARVTVVPGQTSQVLTLYYTDGTYTAIEIPHGLKGNDGAKGADGDTPEITATRNGGNVNIYADGDLIATLSDGRTPVITATKSQGVTTIFVDGVAVAQVEDGTAVTPDLPDVDVVTGVSFSVSNGKLYSITSKQNLKTGNTSQSTAEVCDVGELDVVVSEVYSHLTHQFTNTRKRIKVLGTPVDATGQTPFTATPLSGE